MSILDQLLKKIGVSKYEELNSDEKATFKNWENVLSGRRLTDEDVVAFLEKERHNAVLRLVEVNLSKEDEIFRKVEVRFISKLLEFLNSPKVEKEVFEKQLENNIN